jgi:hypothetical protein
MSTPRRSARLVVRVSTRALPAGPVRDRYRQELAAELYDLDRSRQLQFAAGVASRAWSLRKAVTQENATADELAQPSGVPLSCRLRLRHRYHKASTEDGEVYVECVHCGHIKDNYPDPEGHSMSSRGLPMG